MTPTPIRQHTDPGRRPFCRRQIFRKFLAFLLVSASLSLLYPSADSIQTVSASSGSKKKSAPKAPARDNTPQILTPEAPGAIAYANDIVSMDLSNTSRGYMVLTYTGSNEKVKFQVKDPKGITCTYLVTARSEAVVYPLTGGNGSYTFTVFEAADAAKDLYAVAFTQSADVTLEDEFLPFLTPNVYIDYDADTKAVAKGASLVKKSRSGIEAIEAVYHFVIKNISYDTDKAENVAYGYIPDVDDTLDTKKGICFDYAALMTAMLRSQRIPARLEVGYAGDAYHAWISCYLEETGWVDDIIRFDGKKWSLIDPTLAANSRRASVKDYIGDGSKYTVKYVY